MRLKRAYGATARGRMDELVMTPVARARHGALVVDFLSASDNTKPVPVKAGKCFRTSGNESPAQRARHGGRALRDSVPAWNRKITGVHAQYRLIFLIDALNGKIAGIEHGRG
jgi:hypothetical protein